MAKFVIKNPKTVITDVLSNYDAWILAFIGAFLVGIKEEPIEFYEDTFETVATDIIKGIANEALEIADEGLPEMQRLVDKLMGPTEVILKKLVDAALGGTKL